MIKLTSLWKQDSEKSVKGEYWRGTLGEAYIMIFHNPSTHPKAPDFDLCIAEKPKQRDGRPQSYKAKSPQPVPDTIPVAPEAEDASLEEMKDAFPVEGEEEDDDTEVPW